MASKEGDGYIEDPTGEIKAYGIAVFHQLHCLVGFPAI